MSKESVKKFKVTTEPFCEHCMELGEGSLTIDEGGISWCIACAAAGGKITSEELTSLYKKQRKEHIRASEKKLDQLRNEE